MSFNKIIVVGNLGKDPELRYTPQGTPVTSFSIATNEKVKKNGEAVDVTTWFDATIYGRQAELASQYLQKGRPVYLEGRLRRDEWTDRDGKERVTLKINVTDMQFVGGNGNGQSQARAASAGADGGSTSSDAAPAEADLSDDDIPF